MSNIDRITANNAELRECIEIAESLPDAVEAPSGELEITENGTYDVSQYETAVVEVESNGIVPQGEIAITYNGDYDVAKFATAKVNIMEPLANTKLHSMISGNPTSLVIEASDVGTRNNVIRDYCFYYLDALESITLPSQKNQIGKYAFSQCGKLRKVVFENGQSQLRFLEYAFEHCPSLKELVIPESVTDIVIGTDCFSHSGLEAFDLSKVTSINGSYTFSSSSLETVIWSDVLTKIPNYCFTNCTSLKWFDTKNVTEFGSYAFQKCSFTEVLLSDKVTTLGSGTFSTNRNLTSIHLPDTVTSVGTYAFSNCTALTSVNIPKGVTSLSNGVFQSCTSLPNVTIPNHVTQIGSSTFEYCNLLEYIDLTDYGTDKPFPTLGTRTFTNSGKDTAKGTYEIRVKSGRKAELSAMTNWSALADKIVEV